MMMVVGLWCSEYLYEWLCELWCVWCAWLVCVGVVVCGGVSDGVFDGVFDVACDVGGVSDGGCDDVSGE